MTNNTSSQRPFDATVLGTAPPGVNPNLEHPTWHGQGCVVASSFSLAIMLVMAAVRVYDRFYIMKKWTPDDSVFVVSFISGVSMVVLVIVVVTGGAFGYRAWELRVVDLTEPVLIRAFVILCLTGPISWLIKLSLFSLIYHAFHPIVYIRRLVYIGVIATGIYNLVAAIIIAVLCRPKGSANLMATGVLQGFSRPQCRGVTAPVQHLALLSGIVNLLADFFLLLLPLPAIYKLKISRKRKTGLFLIFLSGTVGCIMSILNVLYRKRGFNDPSRDTFYTTVSMCTVIVLETAIGVSVPCMSSCTKVFSRWSSVLCPFFHAQQGGYQDVAFNGRLNDVQQELQRPGHVKVAPGFNELDTIDRYLGQSKTTQSGHEDLNDDRTHHKRWV